MSIRRRITIPDLGVVLLALSVFIVAIGVAYQVSFVEPVERGPVEVKCPEDLALHYGERDLTFYNSKQLPFNPFPGNSTYQVKFHAPCYEASCSFSFGGPMSCHGDEVGASYTANIGEPWLVGFRVVGVPANLEVTVRRDDKAVFRGTIPTTESLVRMAF